MGRGEGGGKLGSGTDAAPAKAGEDSADAPLPQREHREPSLSFTRALLTYFAFGTMFILGHSRVRSKRSYLSSIFFFSVAEEIAVEETMLKINLVYASYCVVQDFFSKLFGTDPRRKTRPGYAPLCQARPERILAAATISQQHFKMFQI